MCAADDVDLPGEMLVVDGGGMVESDGSIEKRGAFRVLLKLVEEVIEGLGEDALCGDREGELLAGVMGKSSILLTPLIP